MIRKSKPIWPLLTLSGLFADNKHAILLVGGVYVFSRFNHNTSAPVWACHRLGDLAQTCLIKISVGTGVYERQHVKLNESRALLQPSTALDLKQYY